MSRPLLLVVSGLVAAAFCPPAAAQLPLTAGLVRDSALAFPQVHDYVATLRAGESVSLVVRQEGVDVVVEVRDPGDSLLLSVDSPNGRSGDEPAEWVAAAAGRYRVSVRPLDAREPAGRYRLRVLALRDVAETRALLRARAAARDSAARWLAARSAAIPADGRVSAAAPIAPLDRLAARVRILGVGEATHGSREMNDFRVALTRRLIERNGYRVVAIEASRSELQALDRYIDGEAGSEAAARRALASGWIGRRARAALVPWLRVWNRSHPRDRVHLVGVDPQGNEAARPAFHRLLIEGYGAPLGERLAAIDREIAAADSQTAVFGDSRVDSLVRRDLVAIVAMLRLDEPLLVRKVGRDAYDAGLDAAEQLAEFADFNAGPGLPGHSRDWYMAARVLRALDLAGSGAKAVYWAHNAHVATPQGRSPASAPAGALLRGALGCAYGALGTSFVEGAFVAQLPNDSTDRLAVSSLPAAGEETIDAVVSRARPGSGVTVWGCPADSGSAPSWLRRPHPMHWVGALFRPGTPPSEAYRPFDLLQDFDGVVSLERVTADAVYLDRPLVPARQR